MVDKEGYGARGMVQGPCSGPGRLANDNQDRLAWAKNLEGIRQVAQWKIREEDVKIYKTKNIAEDIFSKFAFLKYM